MSVLEASWSVAAANFSHAILDAIFERIFVHSCLRKSKSELRQIIKLYWKNNTFLLPGYFHIRSLPHTIFIPTWLNLASLYLQKPTKIASSRRLGASWARLGGLLGRLGRVLERLGLILERLGASWRRLGASWARLQASGANYVTRGDTRGGGFGARRGPRG